jgi:stage II sporulation protein AA (anti-sigma F factor antagonist)
MPPPSFEIDVEDDGTLAVLRLRGELDLATRPVVQEAVERHGPGRKALVVDLSQLDFMDSSGLNLIIELQGREDGTGVAFVAPDERVGRLLEMTGVRPTLTWVADPRDALRGGT